MILKDRDGLNKEHLRGDDFKGKEVNEDYLNGDYLNESDLDRDDLKGLRTENLILYRTIIDSLLSANLIGIFFSSNTF